MRWSRALTLLLWLAAPLAAAPQLSYEIAVPEQPSNCFEVVSRWRDVPPGPIEIAFPGYALGTHAHHDYARHAFGLQSKQSGEWQEVAHPSGTSTWQVSVGPSGQLELRYRVRATDTITTHGFTQAYLGEQDAYFLPPALCAYPRGTRPADCRLKLRLPADWRVATALPATDGAYVTSSYERLLDAPVQLGRFEDKSFPVADRRVRLALVGDHLLPDESLFQAVQSIARVELAMFRWAPFDQYLFLVHFGDFMGGLEHEQSCTAGMAAQDRDLQIPTLIVAHELFHAWNGRALYHEGWGPDRGFERLAPNGSLWIYEGLTVYFTDVVLWRAGCRSESNFRQTIAESCGNTLTVLGGNHPRTLAALSREALASSQKLNASIFEVYDRGFVTGLMLDLKIRHDTKGKKSLEDVMRWLLAEYGRKGRGYEDDVMASAIEQATGVDATELLRVLVQSTEPPPLQQVLRWGGWDLTTNEELSPVLGVFTESPDSARVAAVVPDSPAARAGITRGDLLLAIGPAQVSTRLEVERAMQQRAAAGDRTPALGVRRGGEEVALSVRLGLQTRCQVKRLTAARNELLEVSLPTETRAWFALGPVP